METASYLVSGVSVCLELRPAALAAARKQTHDDNSSVAVHLPATALGQGEQQQ